MAEKKLNLDDDPPWLASDEFIKACQEMESNGESWQQIYVDGANYKIIGRKKK